LHLALIFWFLITEMPAKGWGHIKYWNLTDLLHPFISWSIGICGSQDGTNPAINHRSNISFRWSKEGTLLVVADSVGRVFSKVHRKPWAVYSQVASQQWQNWQQCGGRPVSSENAIKSSFEMGQWSPNWKRYSHADTQITPSHCTTSLLNYSSSIGNQNWKISSSCIFYSSHHLQEDGRPAIILFIRGLWRMTLKWQPII